MRGLAEGVSQVGEGLVVAAHGGTEGVEHHLVAGGIDACLDAKEFHLRSGAQGLEGGLVGDGNREDACVHLVDIELVG